MGRAWTCDGHGHKSWTGPGRAALARTGRDTRAGAPHGAPNDPGERTMSTRTEGARGRSRVHRASALATRRTPRRGRRAVYALPSPPPRVPWSVSCLHACLAECRCRAVRPGQPPSCHVPARITQPRCTATGRVGRAESETAKNTRPRELLTWSTAARTAVSQHSGAHTRSWGGGLSPVWGSLRSPDFRSRSGVVTLEPGGVVGLRDGRDSNTAPRHSHHRTHCSRWKAWKCELVAPVRRGGPGGPGPGRVCTCGDSR